MTEKKLSPKEHQRRNYILSGDLWKVILSISAPLALYGLFNYLYGFFDLIMVSYIGGNEVASVVFIDEIKQAIMAFGGGIAAGGTVIVARHYGAGKIEEARRNAGASFSLALLVSSIIVIFTLIFGRPLLHLLNAPQEIIDAGIGYFNIQMISTSLIAVNSVFIGLEKAKGNTALILILNIIAMIIKLILSAIFVFGMGLGAEYVALATLIAQGLLMIVALKIMFSKNNSFQIKWRELGIKKYYILPILSLSIPVFTGKFLFSLGKVLVNSMAAVYGPLAVAAFGIAMKLGGGPGSISIIFEESEISIISQNLGNRNLKRAMKTYVFSHMYALIVGGSALILVSNFMDSIIPLFTTSTDPYFRQMILDIYFWEKFSVLTSASIAVITGVFIGFKYTKIAFVLNVARLFIFRLPVLWLLQKTDVGYVALGHVMFISNAATMVLAFVLLGIFYMKIRNYGYMDMHLES
ncbi:MAG: MATE family efflux transporter [Acholeplasmataceae bacterium]|nr:MATE family efflux transporter [Acholeplasmataceae bacterium]